MFLSNFRNLSPMGALYLFRIRTSFCPFELWRVLASLLMLHSFYKNPPTVPPSPTPKLTKKEDSAAVLLIFSDPFVAPEHRFLQTKIHYQYCLQSLHVCGCEAWWYENLQLGDSEAMTGSLLFQICFRLL